MKLGCHILVVAAGPSDHGLCQALQLAGCRVDHAADAAAAVAAAGRDPPALVLLDQQLPEAAAIGRRLRGAGLQMPVLVVADPGTAVACSCAAGGARSAFALPDGGLVLAELERDLLRQALQRTHGNRTRAARLLGINRDRLRYRIHKFHLQEFLAAED